MDTKKELTQYAIRNTQYGGFFSHIAIFIFVLSFFLAVGTVTNIALTGCSGGSRGDETPPPVITVPPTCSNGTCDEGENATNCPSECPAMCGDLSCTHSETNATCSADCAVGCGDGTCAGGETCPADCGGTIAECGNTLCETGESNTSCPADCPATSLSGDVTISLTSGSILAVSQVNTSAAIRATGTGMVSVPNIVGNSSALARSSIITVASSNLALSPEGAGSGAAANAANLAEELSVSVSYSGTETLNSCLVNTPFSDFICDPAGGIRFTRGQLLEEMGSNSTSSFSVSANADGHTPKTSNVLTARKYLITQISNIYEEDMGELPYYLTVYNDALYFVALAAAGQNKIFRYNGTGIERISNINSGLDDDPEYLTVYTDPSGNTALYFAANIAADDRRLIRYDGTNFVYLSGVVNSDPIHLTVYNNALYFSANHSIGASTYRKLFRYNGERIERISDIRPGNNDAPKNLTIHDGALYFSAEIDDGQRRLFRYRDGAIQQIQTEGDTISAPNNMIVYSNALYFSARVAREQGFFRYSDAEGIIQLGRGSLSNLAVYNNVLYGSAEIAEGQSKLFSYDGSNVRQVSNIRATGTDSPFNLTVYNDMLFFGAANSAGQTKLFGYDGTNIMQISNIVNDSHDVIPTPTKNVIYNGALYFMANAGGGQFKLFKLE